MSKKQRILYIATFPPPVHGSAVVSMQIKESKLIGDAFDGDFVNLGTSRRMNEIGKNGILLNLTKLFRFIGSFLRTYWLLLTHRYALCYCAITINGVGFLKDAPFVLLCRLFGSKIVIHQHNKGMTRFVDRPLYHWLYKQVYKDAKVILLSWNLYSDIEKIGKKEDVMICPNGIAPSKVTESFNFQKILDGDRVIHIFFLSNLIESKGCLVLLEACRILKERGLRFFCDFVGGDTKEISGTHFKQEIDKHELSDYVAYHGPKYGNEKDEYWVKADIFVFPTYYYNECFPLVLLEAMEKSVTCISTIEGGISDIIEDGKTGYVVPKHDASALADAIEKLIKDPNLCRKMGKAGRKRFEDRYTKEQFEKTMLGCLRNCIKY